MKTTLRFTVLAAALLLTLTASVFAHSVVPRARAAAVKSSAALFTQHAQPVPRDCWMAGISAR